MKKRIPEIIYGICLILKVYSIINFSELRNSIAPAFREVYGRKWGNAYLRADADDGTAGGRRKDALIVRQERIYGTGEKYGKGKGREWKHVWRNMPFHCHYCRSGYGEGVLDGSNPPIGANAYPDDYVDRG